MTVLCLLMLVAVVVTTLVTSAQIELRARANLVRQAELQALADGLARFVAFKLSRQATGALQGAPLPVDGSPLECLIDTDVARIRVFDAAGLIDLNAAPLGLLQAFFRGLGMPADKASSLAAAVIDFRDPDGAQLSKGAEQADYLSAGLKHGPKNAPFETVMEIDQVLGFNAGLLARSWHFLTVQSRLPGLDPRVAPVELLAMLSSPGMDSGSISQSADLERLRNGFRFAGPITRSRSRDFAIHVQLTDGIRRSYRQATIEIAVQSRLGFMFREWRRGLSTEWMPPKSSELQDCFAGIL